MLNLGAGSTLAYDFDSSDEESMLLQPVNNATAVQASDEDTDGRYLRFLCEFGFMFRVYENLRMSPHISFDCFLE